jgi:hypothetical protein
MKLTDKQYDLIKYLAINVIPSLETAWLIIAGAWKIPFTVEVGATIGAVGIFLAGCIHMSRAEYEKAKRAMQELSGEEEAEE